MATIVQTETHPARPTFVTPRRAFVAGISAGPIFLATVALLTWDELGYLHGVGWSYGTDNTVPWPSTLALGPHGWIQVANFAVTGLLLLVFARGFRAELRGRIGAIASVLLTTVACALMVSAFPTDDSAVRGHNPDTWHGVLHSVGFVVLALSALLAPIFVALALRRDVRRRGIAIVSALAPVLMLILFLPVENALHDIAFTGYLAVVFGWIAVLATALRSSPETTRAG